MMGRNGFRACTEDSGSAAPNDLQHLSARRAASLLPTFPFLEEQGYFPVTVLSSTFAGIFCKLHDHLHYQ